MTVLKVQNLYLATSEASRDADFYQNALGAELRFADGEHWVQLSIGGQNLALAGPRESAVEKGAIVVFEVDSLDTAASAIASAGGRVLSQRDMGDHGRTLTFADPSGNICQLFQRA